MDKLKKFSIYSAWLCATLLFGYAFNKGVGADVNGVLTVDPFLYAIYAPVYLCFVLCPMIAVSAYCVLTEGLSGLGQAILWCICLPWTLTKALAWVAGKLIDFDVATDVEFSKTTEKKLPVVAEVEPEEDEDSYEQDAIEAGLTEDGDLPYEEVTRTYEDVLLEMEAEDVEETKEEQDSRISASVVRKIYPDGDIKLCDLPYQSVEDEDELRRERILAKIAEYKLTNAGK